MPKALTLNEFIERAKVIHDNKYDYSQTQYKNGRTKVKIMCLEHGVFEQLAQSHLQGSGCKKCGESNRPCREDMVKDTASFIRKACIIHGDTYDYSQVIYVSHDAKVEIICKTHGSFYQTPGNHNQGSGCLKCSIQSYTGTTETFIQDAIIIHEGAYDYSHVSYVNNSTKVEIGCFKHGYFQQTPNSHLMGEGCYDCCIDGRRSDTETFIEGARKVHGDTYDYSRVVYVDQLTPVDIICLTHGIFSQVPRYHIHGCGCDKCGIIRMANSHRYTTEQFIELARLVHGNKYEYSQVDYFDRKTKVSIGCPTHGLFDQSPDSHLRGHGCRRCNESKGEQAVAAILEKLNIPYEPQKKFSTCRNIYELPFDFYLKDYNLNIEYDGIQHFVPIEFFGGEEAFRGVQKRDAIKTQWCQENEVNLLRIDYREMDIESLIVQKLKEITGDL